MMSDAASGTFLSPLRWLKQRLALASDTEPEQAIKIRLTLGIGLLIYFCLPWQAEQTLRDSLTSFPSIIALLYYSFALLIATAIIIKPQASPTRRVMGILLDMVSLSVVMYSAGAEAVYLFVLYLWVILGNGFRYGLKYLYISLGVAVMGFTVAISWGDYWQTFDHRPVGISLLFLLLLIPLYAAFLINKLHAAIATARQANEAKSRFLANMSHELRTPLNGVIGIADLMGETPLNQQQREFVHIMRNSANTLLGLIENVLDISKIEAGKITVNVESFDLHRFINSIIQMQKPMGNAKGLHVAVSIDPRLPANLRGDPQHLRQVLINLLSNAIKFTEHGTVCLSLDYLHGDDNKVTVRFNVDDTGIGIPESALATVFDDFTQVIDTSGHRPGSGTGLGTTIARELVQLMGGDIGVESEAGRGTRFWFELTLDLDPQQTMTISQQQLLLLSTEATEQQLQPMFNGWSVNYRHVNSTVRAFAELLRAAESEQAYTVFLVDHASMADIGPVQFAQMLQAESALENLSLVLLNPQQTDIPNLRDYYIASVRDLNAKPQLFNAIHAAQQLNTFDNDKVVRLVSLFGQPSHPLTILVAEDNLVNQQVMRGILKQAGHHMLLAQTGEQALDMLSEQLDNIDLLILDMNMPGYSGLDIFKHLQFMDTRQSTPVIILTADATPEARQRCLDAGVHAFLTKPVQSSTLLQTIADLSPNNQPVPATVTDDGWFDSHNFQELAQLGQDPLFLHRLIDGFKQDGLQHIEILRNAVHDDYFRFRESLHALRGSAAELSAEPLVSLCRRAEQSKPIDIGSQRLLQLTHEIEHSFAQTVKALEQQLAVNTASQTQ